KTEFSGGIQRPADERRHAIEDRPNEEIVLTTRRNHPDRPLDYADADVSRSVPPLTGTFSCWRASVSLFSWPPNALLKCCRSQDVKSRSPIPASYIFRRRCRSRSSIWSVTTYQWPRVRWPEFLIVQLFLSVSSTAQKQSPSIKRGLRISGRNGCAR